MIQYIYFVKCPNCEDEHFDFFDDAKAFALGCLGDKPVITQVEVCRNDFGECTDSVDHGIQWSWEDEVNVTNEKPDVNVFTKGDFAKYNPDADPEFATLDNSVDYEPTLNTDDTAFHSDDPFDHVPDNFRKPVTEAADVHGMAYWAANYLGDLYEMFNTGTPKAGTPTYNKKCRDAYNRTKERWGIDDADEIEDIIFKGYSLWKHYFKEDDRKPVPEGMTIKELVEEMEKNEDDVECTRCNELFDKSECRYEVDLGWLCHRCEAAIKSRGETLTFRENNFLDEETELEEGTSLSDIAKAANAEYGTSYAEDDILAAAGVIEDSDDYISARQDLYKKYKLIRKRKEASNKPIDTLETNPNLRK